MLARFFSAIRLERPENRILAAGIVAILALLGLAALMLLARVPDSGAFDARVERIFVEHEDLTSPAEIALLEILAASGTAFADTLAGYRMVILLLMVFATTLLVAMLAAMVAIVVLYARIREIRREGIKISSFMISREQNLVYLNEREFKLTPAAIETLSVLAEARMDGQVLSGSELEGLISGRDPADCEEAAGATRIKRLRDALGNQLISDLLIKSIARKGYMLTIDKDLIDLD